MSTGGVFTLINNAGIQDQLLMCTDKLKAHLKKISANKMIAIKEKNPSLDIKTIREKYEDLWLPTFKELEQSHILFVTSSFKPFVSLAHEYSKTPPRQGIASLGSTFSFTMPLEGQFVNDAVMYVKLTGLAARSALDKVRYVELLAHRLLKQAKFKTQNYEIDSYGQDYQNAHYELKVPVNKEVGYLRNIGQEIPLTGFLTADPTVDEVREYRFFGNGPQTFKQTQLDVEMWIPMLFWFKDIQCSLPTYMLPFNQTDIEITFESENNLVAFADYGGGGLYNVPVVSECALYLNHIYIIQEIHALFRKRFNFQLIRVHRHHTEQLIESEKSVRLQALKWPMEAIYVGFRPRINLLNSQRWFKNTFIVAREVKEAVVTGVATIQVNNAVYLDEYHVVSQLDLKAESITIYPEMRPDFYNNYLPYQHGLNIKTPKQLGWYMMNFNINPGDQQPSGHFNASRSRELYLHYQSALYEGEYIIRPDNPVDLIVVADVINFLVFQDGNMVLRYST